MGGLAEKIDGDKRNFLKKFGSAIIGVALSGQNLLAESNSDYLNFKLDEEKSGKLFTPEDVDKTIKDLRKQTPKVVDFIGRPYLHLNQGASVNLILIDDGIAFAGFIKGQSYIKVPVIRSRNNTVPYAHELSHLVAFTRYPGLGSLFAEGFGVYVQEIVGDNLSFPNFGNDVDETAMNEARKCYGSRNLPSIGKIVELLNRDKIEDDAERCMAYCIAGSFVKHLYEIEFRGKKELFMDAYYRAKNPFVFEQITGVNFDRSEANWRDEIKK